MYVKKSVIIFLTFTMFSCATLDPYTRESKMSNCAKDAMWGGALLGATGAVIGALAGGGKGAAIGAGSGVALGAAGGCWYGSTIDDAERELRAQLDRTGVRIARNGNRIVLVMPGNITFQTDRAQVRPRFMPVLRSIAIVLHKYTAPQVLVEGHTDSTGSRDYNYDLSRRRALAVADVLIQNGVMPARISARGYGEDRPVASNNSREGRRRNRRVEITLQ